MFQAGTSQVRFPMGFIGFFQFILSFQPHYGPGVDSVSDRNKYQESSCGGGKTRPERKTDSLSAICEPTV
jgi:hypothetical protein